MQGIRQLTQWEVGKQNQIHDVLRLERRLEFHHHL